MNIPKRHQRGFTLIELLVTLAMVGALMAIAIPSMTSFMRNADLSSYTNSLFAGINAARSEAMKRGMYAMVVPYNGTSWSSGAVVFIDVDRSGTHSTGDIDILTTSAAPSYITISNSAASATDALYVRYDPSGYSRLKNSTWGAWTFELKRNDTSTTTAPSETRRIMVGKTGRMRVCTPTSLTTDSNCLPGSTPGG
jgi:type IV fimbrial biogenesis protein FimT